MNNIKCNTCEIELDILGLCNKCDVYECGCISKSITCDRECDYGYFVNIYSIEDEIELCTHQVEYDYLANTYIIEDEYSCKQRMIDYYKKLKALIS
jgi:hypothetical protein